MSWDVLFVIVALVLVCGSALWWAGFRPPTKRDKERRDWERRQ